MSGPRPENSAHDGRQDDSPQRVPEARTRPWRLRTAERERPINPPPGGASVTSASEGSTLAPSTYLKSAMVRRTISEPGNSVIVGAFVPVGALVPLAGPRWSASTSASAVGRMRQQRLLLLWICFRNQRAAMAVGHGDKASGHVVAEERERRRVPAIAHRQRASGAGRVL